MAQAQELSIDFLGDFDFNDFEDLQSFEPFLAGTHKAILNWEAKKINDNNCYVANFTLVETKELKDTTAQPQSPGHVASTSFNLSNETGRGFFKQVLTVLHEKYGSTKVVDLVEASQGNEVLIVTGVRVDKNDDTKKYLQLKSMAFEA